MGIVVNTYERVVTFLNQPLEDAIKDCPGNASNGIGGLFARLALDHLNDLIVIPSGMGVVWDGCTQ